MYIAFWKDSSLSYLFGYHYDWVFLLSVSVYVYGCTVHKLEKQLVKINQGEKTGGWPNKKSTNNGRFISGSFFTYVWNFASRIASENRPSPMKSNGKPHHVYGKYKERWGFYVSLPECKAFISSIQVWYYGHWPWRARNAAGRQTWMITWRIDCVPKVVIPFIDHL